MKKLAVLSLSGGLDSTCLLMKLLSEGYSVYAYSFDYGQRHNIELEKVEINVVDLAFDHNLPVYWQLIDLKDCFSDSQSSLCVADSEIPKGHYNDSNMISTVVENRNVIFASIIYGKALSLSKKENCEVSIYLGIHAGDHTIYPDTTPESREACERAFQVSNWGSEKIHYEAPFVNVDKSEVLHQGIHAMRVLGMSSHIVNEILANTHTCYSPDDKGRACGRCGSCRERLEAFEANHMEDPVAYQEDIK